MCVNMELGLRFLGFWEPKEVKILAWSTNRGQRESISSHGPPNGPPFLNSADQLIFGGSTANTVHPSQKWREIGQTVRQSGRAALHGSPFLGKSMGFEGWSKAFPLSRVVWLGVFIWEGARRVCSAQKRVLLLTSYESPPVD